LSLDPLSTDSPFVFGNSYPVVTGTDGTRAYAFYIRSAGLTDATIHTEVSSDLVNWSEASLEAYPDANYPDLLRLHIPDMGLPVFVRVRVQ
jgi:hypothetical protein